MTRPALEVIDDAMRELKSGPWWQSDPTTELNDARQRIAELVEAAEDCCSCGSYNCFTTGERNRLRTALSAIRGTTKEST